MKRLLFILVILFLVGCEAVPEGSYSVYPRDGQAVTPATFEAQGRTFYLDNPPSPQPTYTFYPTFEPTSESGITPTASTMPAKACVAAVQGSSQAVRSNHALSASLVRWALSGERLDVLSFYIYEAGIDEWAEVEDGWVQVGSNVLIGADDTMEICLDPDLTPVVYDRPTPTPVPTAVATTVPTVTPAGCQITATGNVNVRVVPGGTIVGLINEGTTTVADAKYTYSGLLYYRIFYKGQNAWVADYFAETGCTTLPIINPF